MLFTDKVRETIAEELEEYANQLTKEVALAAGNQFEREKVYGEAIGELAWQLAGMPETVAAPNAIALAVKLGYYAGLLKSVWANWQR